MTEAEDKLHALVFGKLLIELYVKPTVGLELIFEKILVSHLYYNVILKYILFVLYNCYLVLFF